MLCLLSLFLGMILSNHRSSNKCNIVQNMLQGATNNELLAQLTGDYFTYEYSLIFLGMILSNHRSSNKCNIVQHMLQGATNSELLAHNSGLLHL